MVKKLDGENRDSEKADRDDGDDGDLATVVLLVRGSELSHLCGIERVW